MSSAVREAARALRSHAKRTVDVLGPQPPKYAIVMQIDPLVVELTDHRIQLTDEEIVLTQSARKYDLEHGIQEGDTVLMVLVGNGDWVLSGVVSEKVTFGGASTKAVVTGGRVFASGTGVTSTPITHAVPYYDESGVILGYIPLIA